MTGTKPGHLPTCNKYCAIMHCQFEGCTKDNAHGSKFCYDHLPKPPVKKVK